MSQDVSKALETIGPEAFMEMLDGPEDVSRWLEAGMQHAIRGRIRERSLVRMVLRLEGTVKKYVLREEGTDTLSYQKKDGSYASLVEQNFRGKAIGTFVTSPGWRIPFLNIQTEILQAEKHMILAEEAPAKMIVDDISDNLLAAEDARMVELVNACVSGSSRFVDQDTRTPSAETLSVCMQELRKNSAGNMAIACSDKTFGDIVQMPTPSPKETKAAIEGITEKIGKDTYLGSRLIVMEKGRMPDDTFFLFSGGADGAGPMAVLREPGFYIRSIFGRVKWSANMVEAFSLDSKKVAVYRYGDAVTKFDTNKSDPKKSEG